MDDAVKQRFERSYDEYADQIFRYALVKTRDRQSALDLTQETFARTWQYMREGKEIREMRPFLYRVAHNLWVKAIRAERRTTSLEHLITEGWQPVAEHDIEEEARAREDQERILSKLAELDDDHREVLVLRYTEEMSVKDMARILGQTENAVSVRIHRAKKKLGELFNIYE